MFRAIAGLIARELSGDRAKAYAADIHRTDRFSSFDLYRRTAQYCREQVTMLGLEAVEVIPLKADGRTPYGDWVIPKAWDAREAVLKLTDTARILARYPDVPASLSMYSAPTSPEGITSLLIQVEDLNHIPDDFRGKLVYFNGRVGKTDRAKLAERGIAGIVFHRGGLDFPDMRKWDNYMLAPRNEEGLFGFSLSYREAAHLQERLHRGPVEVDACVDTRLYDGIVENITGVIPGTDGQEEVLMLAHIYEQGANDNASGAGASLEVFRTLKTLIDAGDLPRPRRTMRLLLGFECCGFMGYVVQQEERMRRTVAAINPDMVGEDQERCGSSFGLHLTPGAAPSCVDALAIRLFTDLIQKAEPLLRWRTEPYTICDSFIADPSIGVPSVSIIGTPDRYYHSSMDEPDKVSPATLSQTGLVLATYLYFLANAGSREAGWLAEEMAVQVRCQLAEVAGAYLRRLSEGQSGDVLREAGERLPFLAERSARAVASTLRFADTEALRHKIHRLQRELRAAADAELARLRASAEEQGGMLEEPTAPEQSILEERASGMIPTRQVVGPLTLEPLLLRAEGPFPWEPGWSAPYNDHLIWADGQRSVLDIWRCTRLERGNAGPPLQEIVNYFEFLATHGYVRLR